MHSPESAEKKRYLWSILYSCVKDSRTKRKYYLCTRAAEEKGKKKRKYAWCFLKPDLEGGQLASCAFSRKRDSVKSIVSWQFFFLKKKRSNVLYSTS
jgi:hypothetical protein